MKNKGLSNSLKENIIPDMERTEARKLSTAFDVIWALGGTAKAAELMQVGPSAVCNMVAKGKISYGFHRPIAAILDREGHSVDEEAVFGSCIEDWINRYDCIKARSSEGYKKP